MKQKAGYLENSKSIQNLRRRIFWILFGLLAFFCGMVLILSLWRDYSDLKRNVGEVMKQASSYNYAFRPGYSEEEDSPIKQHTALSGLPVFTLRVKDGQGLAFYYQNTTEEEALEASQYATDIVQYARPGEIHVGNLYSDQYVWDYSNPGTFSMVDVSSLGTQLRDILGLSMVFYVLFLAVTALIIKWVTEWLTRPIEETMRRQKQFIADASHELKTPLAVIMANAEAMEHNPDPKWLHNIADESEKMNQLVVSMLDLARSEEEALVLEPVNLSLLAEKECLMQEAVVFEHNMILETEIEEDLWVKADKTKAAQLITILLDNAQKHAKSAIRVSLKREGKQAVLKVMNNGVPIPVEDREHIFERFYRGDKSRARASGRYGLGLAIAKNIALSHQSRIWADCSEGWTEFCWKIKLENGKSESQ